MGTALSPITPVFQSHQLRLLIKDGVPYWVGKDACEGVGISAYRGRPAKPLSAYPVGTGVSDLPGPAGLPPG